jgi:hypothetical protein
MTPTKNRTQWGKLVTIVNIGLILTQCANASQVRHDKRAVTVRDAIEMAQIGDRSYRDSFTKTDNVVQFSPDGSKFAFVIEKDNLDNDTVDSSLLVFHTAEIFVSPHPQVVATFASSSNREGISHVQWLPDNDTLAFLGERPGENAQLYEASATSRRVQRLTNHPTPLVAYCMANNGKSFVYIAEARNAPPVISDKDRQQGFFVTSQKWDDIYTNRRSFNTRFEIYVKTPKTKMPQRAGDAVNALQQGMELSISPNGRYALVRAYRTSPPSRWSAYQYKSNGEVTQSLAACSSEEPFRCPEQFYLIDLNNKTIEPLLDAPIVTKSPAGNVLAAWTHKNSVLLINTLLPIDSTKTLDHNPRLSHVYVAEVTVPDRGILTIADRTTPYPVGFITSSATQDIFIIKTGIAALGPPLEVLRGATGWKVLEMTGSAPEPERPISVTLNQSFNSPPKLVATDMKTGHSAVVLDLNPQFADLTFGRIEIFSWKTREGKFGEGTLYYPPNYVQGRKYPLIIQTHDERRERFWIDGPYTTAYAAEPLANAGFIVLQTGLVDIYEKSSVDELFTVLGTPQEGPHYMALFESAIDILDQRGLVDRDRIGISGFSRTVYHVLYTLTHSHYHFAAAVAADGVNFGYVGCVYYLAQSDSSLCEKMNGGGPPYGQSLIGWITNAPTFRLDRISAPLLLQAVSAPLGEWEVLSGLRWLKKPVEMLNFYPEGQHVLIRPRQRLLSQGIVVDWYRFWLLNEKDSDPSKSDQYKRWQKMKEEQHSRDAHAND